MKLGKSSFTFNGVYLEETATIVGDMESKGPLSEHFDIHESDPYFGQKSWEQAEIQMSTLVIKKVLEKANLQESDIDLAFGGDLVNQIVPSNYTMRQFDIPFFGVYSACASGIQALILASTYVAGQLANRGLAFASSHNNLAEKQFRNPVEYGAPKGGTAQYTTTGAGVAIASNVPSDIKIESATIGAVVDYKLTNPADMGSAMAPAAALTIKQHFEDLNLNPNYYDLIVTGDIADVGSPILIDLLKQVGYDISDRHQDCGSLIYAAESPTFSGASGAGCVSVVTFGYLCDLLRTGKVSRVLVVGTGALLNPLIMAQKETIPCVAHAIALTSQSGGRR